MAFETDIFGDCDELFFCLGNWANTVTSGTFWTLVLLGFAVVLYLATIIRFGNSRAFGFASMGAAFGSFMLLMIGFIPQWIGLLFIIVGGIGLAVLFMNEK